MSGPLLPRYRRLMSEESWGRTTAGVGLGAIVGALHGFALLALLPAMTALVTGEPSWGLGLAGWLVMLSVIAIVAAVLDFWGMRTGYIGALGFIHEVHEALGAKVASMPLGAFDGASPGKYSRMVSQEMMNLGESIAHFVYAVIQRATSAVVIMIGVWFWDWRLGLFLLLACPVVIGFMAVSQRLVARGKRIAEPGEEELSTRMVEYAKSQGALRSCRQAANYPALERAFDTSLRTGRKALWLETAGNVINGALVQVIIVVMIMMTAHFAITGQWEGFAAVITIGMCLRFTTMLEDLVTQIIGIEERRELMDHVDEVMDTPSLREPEVSAPLTNPGEVELKDVSFSYHEGTPVLHDISFRVAPGNMCALVGPSGCGKTTIARLVARFWDTSAGDVSVGGVNVTELTTIDLMAQLSLVFQDVYLFDDTLEANIQLGNPAASPEQVRWAAELAGVSEIVKRLPAGWDTRVGEGGRALSGGERQRVSIARALVKQAPIVLFDEATSALDAENEANIIHAMGELRKNSTLIVIAHKLETIAAADQIVVLDATGRICQQGRHEDLLAAGGQYTRFWNERTAARGWALR